MNSVYLIKFDRFQDGGSIVVIAKTPSEAEDILIKHFDNDKSLKIKSVSQATKGVVEASISNNWAGYH